MLRTERAERDRKAGKKSYGHMDGTEDKMFLLVYWMEMHLRGATE